MQDYTEKINKLNQLRKKSQKSVKRKIKKKLKRKSDQLISEITTAEWMIVGSIAVINDACDYIGLDLIFFRSIDLITAVILGLWCFFRLHKFPSARFGATFIVELIPGLGDISPTWTIFIISMYLKHNSNLEELTKLTKKWDIK